MSESEKPVYVVNGAAIVAGLTFFRVQGCVESGLLRPVALVHDEKVARGLAASLNGSDPQNRRPVWTEGLPTPEAVVAHARAHPLSVGLNETVCLWLCRWRTVITAPVIVQWAVWGCSIVERNPRTGHTDVAADASHCSYTPVDVDGVPVLWGTT